MNQPHKLVQACNPAYHPLPQVNLRPVWKKYSFRTPLREQAEGAIVRVGGPRLAGFHPVVPDKGYQNFLAAINKRCNYYDAGIASSRVIKSSIDLINKIAPVALPTIVFGEALWNPWIARFGPEKQSRMLKAIEDWADKRIGDYSSKDVFVKTEALLVAHKPNWAPRIINKGSDFYNALSGPIFWELMHRLDAAAEAQTGPHQVKFSYGRTPEQYVPFLSDTDGEFLESDFSANDKKQCSDVIRLECMLMRRLGAPEWFIRLHQDASYKYQVKNREHGFKATIENQLATGATDTTFRNCFWNWCILNVFISKYKPERSRTLILGDDMLARIKGLPRKAARKYEQCATDARMDAKVSRHGKLVDASFLSKCFVPREEAGHSVIPILGKALGRFNTRANANHALTDNAYFAAKSLSYAYEFRYSPSLRDVFLDRFNHHAPLVAEEKQKFKFAEEGFSWNAKEAGLTLANFKHKLIVGDEHLITEDDLARFFLYRYGLSFSEVMQAVEYIVLDVSGDDYDGYMLERFVADFA